MSSDRLRHALVRCTISVLAVVAAVLVIAAMPLVMTSERGVPQLDIGAAVAEPFKFLRGIPAGESFRYGVARWNFLEQAPLYFMFSLMYVALPGCVGIAGGAVCGILARRTFGGIASRILNVVSALPDFLVAVMLQLFSMVLFHVFGFASLSIAYGPTSGALLALPFFLMALYPFAATFRVAALSMRELDGSEFVRFARARGIPEGRIAARHYGAAIVPAITERLSLILSVMQGNLFIAEYLFGLPGLSRVLFTLAFTGSRLGWYEQYQYNLGALALFGIVAVYAISYAAFRAALAVLRRGLTGEW